MQPNFFKEALSDPIILSVTSFQLLWALFSYFQLTKLKDTNSRQKINYYSFESIPSTFVTIGLFGTCLGIAIGLYHFDINPSNIKESVQLLLRGLKSAFFTTIIGLLFSLIFKQVINHYLNKYADIQPPESPELIQLKEMNLNLQLLGSNISESFKKKFDMFIRDMRESNGQLIANLNHFTENLAQQNQDALIEALQEVVTDLNTSFKDVLGAMVHQNFQSLIESVDNLNKWQVQYKKQVELLSQKYLDITTNTEKLNKSLEDILAKNDELIGQNSKLNQIIDSLNKVIVYDEKFVQIVTKLSNGADQISAASNSYAGNLIELKEMKNSINNWFANEGSIKESIILLNKQIETLKTTYDLPDFHKRLSETFGTLDKLLERQLESIPKIIEKTNKRNQ